MFNVIGFFNAEVMKRLSVLLSAEPQAEPKTLSLNKTNSRTKQE